MGKHLHEVLGWSGPMTHRQELAWAAWELLDLNTPGKVEHYLMLGALETVRVNVKNPNSVKLSDMRLTFGTAEENRTMDPEMLKKVAIGVFGAGLERRTRTRAEAVALGLLPPDDETEEDDDG